MTEYVRYHSGEWSALYEDGKLVRVGDHYLTDEYLAIKLKVENIYDNDDFLSEDGRGALPTLEEVQAVSAGRKQRAAQARQLRIEANALLEEAKRLESA